MISSEEALSFDCSVIMRAAKGKMSNNCNKEIAGGEE